MDASANSEQVQQRIDQMSEHLVTIRRNLEKMMAENQRLREVVRLAESELRNRRDQVQRLEGEIERLQSDRLDAKARVDHAIEKIDELISNAENENPS